MRKKIMIFFTSILIIGLVCYGYYFVTQKAKQKQLQEKPLTEVQQIITKNLSVEYPPTPRAVVSLYNRIITAYYREEYTQEEFEKMADLARGLFDEELLQQNPRELYLSNLASEINSYRAKSKTIESNTVEDSKNIEYLTDTEKGDFIAYVDTSYFLKEEKSTFTKTYMQFILRKDSDGKWKILGFYKIDAPSAED